MYSPRSPLIDFPPSPTLKAVDFSKSTSPNENSIQPFLSFCTVCDMQLDSSRYSHLYCSEDCKSQDSKACTTLPPLTVLDLALPPPSPPMLYDDDASLVSFGGNTTDSTRDSLNSLDLTFRQSSLYSTQAARLSASSFTSSIKYQSSCALYSPLHSPKQLPVISNDEPVFDDEDDEDDSYVHLSSYFNNNHNNNNNNNNSNKKFTFSDNSKQDYANHRVSAPEMAKLSGVARKLSFSSTTSSIGSDSPRNRPRRQSFYIRSGSQLYSTNNGPIKASINNNNNINHNNNDHNIGRAGSLSGFGIDSPNPNLDTNSSFGSPQLNQGSFFPESPRSIMLVLPSNILQTPTSSEFEYEFPKIDTSSSYHSYQSDFSDTSNSLAGKTMRKLFKN